MKYASVHPRKNSPYWYVSYLDASTGKRKQKATVHRTDDPSGRRRAYDEAQQLSKEAIAKGAADLRAGWTWVTPWLQLTYVDKTLQRYETAWSHVQEFIMAEAIINERSVRYEHANRYILWRTQQKRRRGTKINYNTALTELKVFATVMRESVRLGLCDSNPLAQLGLRRRNVRQKRAITPDEIAKIQQLLVTEPEWMRDSFLIAIHQGCRISETKVPLDQVDLVHGAITFRGKGNKVFTTLLHPALRSFVEAKRNAGAQFLCELPQLPAKAWHSFFNRHGLGHLSFHSTRVTVISQLVRNGVPQGMAQQYVGHASETVHRLYQRLSVADLGRAADAIASWPASQGDPAPTAQTAPGLYIARRRKANREPTLSPE